MKITKKVLKEELKICRKMSRKNNGKCSWGSCKNCGVIPLLYKLGQGVLIEDKKEIKKIKKSALY